MNCKFELTFVVFGKRLVTLLYILCIVGGRGARRAPGARRTAKPNMSDQNIKINLIWVKIGTREFTKKSKIPNGRQKCTSWLYY